MATDPLSTALVKSMARDLSVGDLVPTAELLKQSGNPAAVDALYETWTRHNPDHPMLFAVLFNHSVVLTDANRLDAARDALTRATSLNPDFMPAYINLGRVYERQGNVAMAVARRRIKTGGDVKAALALIPITKPIYDQYRDYVEREKPHLKV